ncbi:MAG TPA: cytochrome c [Steroidobacteraceae bacterium]|jgi:mono/diheme cytochrome c family protein|nr:cytochrome c [Steroidobacteraceae bacterium]
MRTLATVAVTLVSSLAALGAGAAVFVTSGAYNIGADDHHTTAVFAMIEELRQRSIDVRSRTLAVPPNLDDDARIREGAAYYAAHCPLCHLAPGVDRDKADVRRGMYPHPPNLSQEGVNDPGQAFWIVKHGIKMSAMPSWRKTLDDEDIWDVVAFLRKVPGMTAERYQQLSGGDH